MTLYSIHRIQTLPISLEEAWQFFSSPSNLPAITPPWLNLSITGEVPETMFPGTVIPYRVAPLFGIRLSWITEITHVAAPHYFVDEQRFGPYRFWHHAHHFRPVGGGIETIDRVHYILKFGPLGRIMHSVFIKKRLEDIFDFRRKKLDQLFSRQGGA